MDVGPDGYFRDCHAQTLTIDTEGWLIFQPGDRFHLIAQWESGISWGSDVSCWSSGIECHINILASVTGLHPLPRCWLSYSRFQRRDAL